MIPSEAFDEHLKFVLHINIIHFQIKKTITSKSLQKIRISINVNIM